LKPAQDKLVNTINSLIIKYIEEKIGDRAQVLYFHLDGKLPYDFEQKLFREHTNLFSVPPFIETIGKQLHCSPQRHPDGHPKSGLNRIYAYFIGKQILAYKEGLK
jgi:hypothetical protein